MIYGGRCICLFVFVYLFDLLTSRCETTQVIGRPRGATPIFVSLPGWALKGMAPYNEGSFTCKRAMGILHGTTPIEPSLKEFSHTRKIPRWSGSEASTQPTEPPNHPSDRAVAVDKYLLTRKFQGARTGNRTCAVELRSKDKSTDVSYPVTLYSYYWTFGCPQNRLQSPR